MSDSNLDPVDESMLDEFTQRISDNGKVLAELDTEKAHEAIAALGEVLEIIHRRAPRVLPQPEGHQ